MLDILKPLILITIAIFAHKWMWTYSCSKSTRLVFWVVFFRFVLASFHEFAYPQIIGPFSIVSLYSIFVVSFLLLFIISNDVQINRNYCFFIISMILVSMVLAAIINTHYVQSVASIVKWLMLLLLVSLIYDALSKDGVSKVLRSIGFAYLYPIILMIASVVLGISKATENDGSVSYVGGFNHEAVFSVIIFSGVFVYIMIGVFDKRIKLVFGSMFTLVLLLALINYRTSILACVGMYITIATLLYFRSQLKNKLIVTLFAVVALGVLVNVDSSAVMERFQEIPQAINDSAGLTVFPELYDSDERKYFSGRIYFWSSYIHEALNGTTLQILFGHGMDSWKGFFEKYAHNTFVSFFYELGIVGVILLIVFFIMIIMRALYGFDWLAKVFLLGSVVAFVILNLATMPLWQIEGVIFLSIIIALVDLNKKSLVNKESFTL
ncbi:hypothetical protein EGH82_22035 [Vibrio ponticus]|uniref:O-antigen ligase-related domain-containing protein n=1 Tax=Vibrio ponticus TaxID=265668 RepID=A0A3N3DTD1_9VIBR|nr:O-antigen ligase family protein [Vibrio ponticus]ROV57656.1 hypothetical protein EGH82_22035 [Vibrio ponticus]